MVSPGQVASGEEVGAGFEDFQDCGGAGDGVVDGDPIGAYGEVGAVGDVDSLLNGAFVGVGAGEGTTSTRAA